MVSSSAEWTWPTGLEPGGKTDTPIETCFAALFSGPKYACQVRPGSGTTSASARVTRLIIGTLVVVGAPADRAAGTTAASLLIDYRWYCLASHASMTPG